ncbi:MAG: NUDIX hydrolase [Deltaproteobacteria bacterium]|jgi:8-oxo-dGTP pyrophosphatase MutT (NUDIX family)|nr:NUDIX hydrolase [Deltaproteobacteria bacterium]
MGNVPDWYFRQSGVIPYRASLQGPEVLLITSRRRKHWVIPKGVVEPHMTHLSSACQEAWEEAGLHGQIYPESVGTYQYRKWGGTCEVQVYLLAVDRLADQWPERSFRSRQWVLWNQAAELVRDSGLARLLKDLPNDLQRVQGSFGESE